MGTLVFNDGSTLYLPLHKLNDWPSYVQEPLLLRHVPMRGPVIGCQCGICDAKWRKICVLWELLCTVPRIPHSSTNYPPLWLLRRRLFSAQLYYGNVPIDSI